jgi:S1-C subfamily serine protease
LPTLPWGDSDKLRVAEWVLAIGNPFQLSGTVTLGIVSTVKRAANQVGGYSDFIQTDAAINPGNSGGALVNARGELVGINSMIVSESGGNQGLGFAIPANLARRIMDELIKNGEVLWGSIGAYEGVSINRDLAQTYGLGSDYGVFLQRIGPTIRNAGLQRGDIIVALDGQKITDGNQLDRLITGLPIGKQVTLEVVRNGRHQNVKLTIQKR